MSINTKRVPLVLRVPQELTDRYALAVSRYGPLSPQVQEIRQANAGNEDFLMVADALDRLKRSVGGSGVDWKYGEKPELRSAAGSNPGHASVRSVRPDVPCPAQ